MPNVCQSLRLCCFLVQTSSCNFILESLWIPGTSILRYGIYRLNYESKLYQYVKILYVQLNCSMLVHRVVYALLFAGWLCRTIVNHGHAGSCFISSTCGSLMTQQGDAGVRRPVLLCLVQYSYLDCRRLVKHENVPSNFRAPPLYVCMYKNVTY